MCGVSQKQPVCQRWKTEMQQTNFPMRGRQIYWGLCHQRTCKPEGHRRLWKPRGINHRTSDWISSKPYLRDKVHRKQISRDLPMTRNQTHIYISKLSYFTVKLWRTKTEPDLDNTWLGPDLDLSLATCVLPSPYFKCHTECHPECCPECWILWSVILI